MSRRATFDPRRMVGVLGRAGLKLGANGHAVPRQRLEHSIPGYCCLQLWGDPPTATSQDKVMKRRERPGGGSYQAPVNSPALEQAWAWYMQRIRPRASPAALLPPYLVRIEFRFRLPDDPSRWPRFAEPGGHHMEKPDLDNLKKLVIDVLAGQAYLVDDRMVALDGGSGKRWATNDRPPGVTIWVRSLMGAWDVGPVFSYPAGQPWDGHVEPHPWVLQADEIFIQRVREQQAKLAAAAVGTAPALAQANGAAVKHCVEPRDHTAVVGPGSPPPAPPQARNGHATNIRPSRPATRQRGSNRRAKEGAAK